MTSDLLSIGFEKFRWVTEEMSVVKGMSTNYKWQRKDGSWWTNHQGQIVPYHEPKHGSKDASPLIAEYHDHAEEFGRQEGSDSGKADEHAKHLFRLGRDLHRHGLTDEEVGSIRDHGRGLGNSGKEQSDSGRGVKQSLVRENPPQVAQPTALEGKIVLPDGSHGKGYALPGFEEYRFVAIKSTGNKAHGTKKGWSVVEATTGTEIAEPKRHLMEDTEQGALALAHKKLHQMGKEKFDFWFKSNTPSSK